MADLVIRFDNEAALSHFAHWLCGSGEQHYWQWMEEREGEEDGDITAIRFGYHGEEDVTKERNDPLRYKGFLCDNTIRAEVGRFES